MPPRQQPPLIGDPNEFLSALRSPHNDLREQFMNNPVALAERLGLKLPRKPVEVMQELGVYDPEKHGPITPGIRDLIEDVCLGLVKSAAAVANRGGGKSQGVAYIEFFLVLLKDYDALNLGGSELQADQVYQYLLAYIESDPFWKELIRGEPMRERTFTIYDAWIRVLTASQKSVRSPHAGGRKKSGRLAGGLLVIDEEAEAAPDIVVAALPTVNTARPSVVVRCSTFHNNEGTFAELVDHHKDMGFKLYQWSIFDVCERCDCTGPDCQSEEQCFREDHYEDVTDPTTGITSRKMLHRAYCGGKAKYADGWIPMDEVLALWRRMRRNHSRWEVEAMGSRPTTAGHVLKDQMKFAENITTEMAASLYKPRSPIDICVDWGTVNAGVTVWQELPYDQHLLLHADLIPEAGPTQILSVILGYWGRYVNETNEVAADIGGGGNYMNLALREEQHIPCRDVNFAEEKEAAAAALNIYNEANKIIIPDEHWEFIEQMRKWRRKNGRIQKGDDHLCDSSLCYFSKFIDRLGLQNVRVKPRSFNTTTVMQVQNGGSSTPPRRRPMIRGIGGSRGC